MTILFFSEIGRLLGLKTQLYYARSLHRSEVMRVAVWMEPHARSPARWTGHETTRERPFRRLAVFAIRLATGWTRWLPAYRRLRPVVRVLIVGCAVLLILPYVLTPLYRVADPVSTLMLWRRATGGRVERIVKPIDLLAPSLPRAVLVAEDERFCSHHGIDLEELRRVIKAEADGVRRPRGGSSITQQLAKNLFLWHGRSYVRKALELPLALWIDFAIPKRRQLEIYLNIVEWGPNGEFGAEAGARRAFGKSASSLSASQAALLAAALPNPIRRDTRRPNVALRRLAATYVQRTAAATDIDRCVRAAR
jgi:monofunctional biosynthetic peptidoglycan transglycosylase